jgi:predicted MPP superfamily phosphohydrolase
MKHMWPVISLFMIIYCLANYYILSRGWQLLEAAGSYRWLYVAAGATWALLFLAGMILKRSFDSAAADLLWRAGSWWLVILLYTLLAALCFDLIRLAWQAGSQKLVGVVFHCPSLRLGLFAAFTLILAILVGTGYYNGTHAKVKTLDWELSKNVPGAQELTIVAVSDMHLGAVYSTRSLRRWVSQINALQPDIVFLLGDTFDDNPAPVLRKKLGLLFEQINAPLGVYAVTGNHELMGRPKVAMDYLAQHGVQPLVDTAVLVADRFYVVGRLDRSAKERKSIAELTAPLNKELPVILLDHQPYEWDAAAGAGVDIGFSGHTHHGQLWPMNLLTQSMYEQDWGYLRKGATHFYTSCGIGAWGPPVRIASRSEIVRVRVRL